LTEAGWAMKPWAMLMSSFQEVLFMDADVLFFVDPETLFEDPQYRATRALFFKDRNLGREEKRKWLKKVLPSPISKKMKENRLWTGESGHMQDSGVVIIDKWVHFVPLLLTTRLNGIDRDGNSDTGKKGVYEMVYGKSRLPR
jgi:alpha 1,3-mannosyltransferase